MKKTLFLSLVLLLIDISGGVPALHVYYFLGVNWPRCSNGWHPGGLNVDTLELS